LFSTTQRREKKMGGNPLNERCPLCYEQHEKGELLGTTMWLCPQAPNDKIYFFNPNSIQRLGPEDVKRLSDYPKFNYTMLGDGDGSWPDMEPLGASPVMDVKDWAETTIKVTYDPAVGEKCYCGRGE
jgi:hypothetical protein